MSGLVQDARFGLRLLRRSPGFTAIVLAAVAAMLALVALPATCQPALRAGRLDPLAALRDE